MAGLLGVYLMSVTTAEKAKAQRLIHWLRSCTDVSQRAGAKLAATIGPLLARAGAATAAVFVKTWSLRAWRRAKLSILLWRVDLAEMGINNARDALRVIAETQANLARVAFTIRVGVGALFVIGGWNKLSKLLAPATSDGLIASYTSSTGYINEFFMAFLFAPGSALTPWGFLTVLSTFELVTGFLLIVGFLVRPLALVYGFLLWTFVLALPVVTTNGVDPGVKTYMAPAMLVQIRDIALSGIMFALYGLGSGYRSMDRHIFGRAAIDPLITWDTAGLLLRLSLASVLIVGGVFAGMPNIKTFIEPGLVLAAVGLILLWGGRIAKYAAAAAFAIVVVYMLSKLSLAAGVVGNLNAVKREIALAAAFLVLALKDSGSAWTGADVLRRFGDGCALALANLAAERAPGRRGL